MPLFKFQLKKGLTLGGLYLPARSIESETFSEALTWLNGLPKNEAVYSLNADLLFAAADRPTLMSDFQSTYLLLPEQENAIIQKLSREKINYIFVVQDGNYYPQALGFLYGLDLNHFLKSNYYTYRKWGGDTLFENFRALKDNQLMVYILRKRESFF